MANSKYEYVKSFEVEDEIKLPNIIIVRLDGRNFSRFSKFHDFEKPEDGVKGTELMNECANAVLEQFPDITFSYGFSDEYSFILNKATLFYNRRSSKIQSLIVSFFTSVYVAKWISFFPQKDLRYAPSFRSQVICCSSMEVLQAYLVWRQSECHINYKKDSPDIFRQGTCTLKTHVEDIVKYKDDGRPVKRSRRKVIRVHSENIASTRFWNEQLCLEKELGQFTEDLNETESEYAKSFLHEIPLPSAWVVVRIDGCHFHRFSDVHQFEKPNDAQALNLMNSCATGVLEEFEDIVFAYGVSDEYSFVLEKGSSLCERRASGIVSGVVSFFSSMYTMKWKDFFPHKEMINPPYFDGRAVCYPSCEILRDYLAWRQVDCHINNQYNTCFWMLVKSGKSKSEAQNYLKGTRTREKNELLDRLSGIVNYYNTLPPMFRHGSSIYWEKELKMVDNNEGAAGKSHKIVVVKHCNIIETSFWDAHPEILDESQAVVANHQQNLKIKWEMKGRKIVDLTNLTS